MMYYNHCGSGSCQNCSNRCTCQNNSGSCGCSNGCSGCGSNGCGCSGNSRSVNSGCQGSEGSCGCSDNNCGCRNSASPASNCGCSSCSGRSNNGCGCGCEHCVHTRISTMLPLNGACRICGSGVTINSVQTAQISGRYVASINYTVTVTYLNNCGCRRTATTTQTTQTYLPNCCRTNNPCVRVESKNISSVCCGACFTAILSICC